MDKWTKSTFLFNVEYVGSQIPQEVLDIVSKYRLERCETELF